MRRQKALQPAAKNVTIIYNQNSYHWIAQHFAGSAVVIFHHRDCIQQASRIAAFQGPALYPAFNISR
jgi:hypothetical protein